MAGFASRDQIIQAQTNGQTWRADWSKNANPTAAAVANEWHTLFRGNGNPGPDAIFDAGSALLFQGVVDSTTNAAAIQHGGNVQPTYSKFLLSGSAVSAAATAQPTVVTLIDVVGFYRVTAVTTTTEQATTNTLGFGDTFTADAGTDIITWTSTTNIPSNILPGTKVRLTTTTTLPAGLALATDYFVIPRSERRTNSKKHVRSSLSSTEASISWIACVVFRFDRNMILYMALMRALCVASSPFRLRPTLLGPQQRAGLPSTIMYGGTSRATRDSPPTNAIRPTTHS